MPPPPSYSAPPQPPRPPAPPRPPRVPGPGKGAYLAFLGVMVLSAAIVFGIMRAGELAVAPPLAWGACLTVGLGAILVVVAISGRRFGLLGFLSVVAVLVSLVLTANADEIRRDYADTDQPWATGDFWDDGAQDTEPDVEMTEAEAEEPFDATASFVDDYSRIYVGEGCWALSSSDDPASVSDASAWNGAGQSRIRLDGVTEDVTITAGAGATRLEVPAGTGVIVTAEDYVHLVWEQRDLACDAWPAEWSGADSASDPTEQLRATNPGEPVVTIAATGESAAVFIEEVQP